MTATDLDQELAELRSAADAYAARHQFIEILCGELGLSAGELTMLMENHVI